MSQREVMQRAIDALELGIRTSYSEQNNEHFSEAIEMIRAELAKPERVVLLNNDYSGESIYDVGRDVHESFDPSFTPEAAQIPTDEHGFQSGTFNVTVSWAPEPEPEVSE